MRWRTPYDKGRYGIYTPALARIGTSGRGFGEGRSLRPVGRRVAEIEECNRRPGTEEYGEESELRFAHAQEGE
jgi:hypothetical protein